MPKFANNINLQKNELQNALIHKLAAAPGSPTEGQVYYDTVAKKLYYRTDSAWYDVTNALTLAGNAETLYARLASPTFTGTPAAPTAAPGTNTTQIATAAFVTAAVAAAVVGLLDDKGDLDASTNPNYPAALKGDIYRISVAGKVGGASGVNVNVGDWVRAIADNAGGTQAAVGTSWAVSEANIDGAVTLLGTQTLENKTIALGSNTVSGTKAQFDAAVTDGNFLYVGDITQYTDEMAQDAIGAMVVDTATIDVTYVDATPELKFDVKANSITEAMQVLADNTTNDVSITKHGYTPKAPNDTAKFLRGDGTWATPTGSGTVNKYSALIGDGAATTITITQATHGLAANSQNVVQVMDATSGEVVYPDITVVPANGNVTLVFSVAPANNSLRVVITG